MLVREFLLANDADDDLVDAIDVAIDDIEQHINPVVEAALEEGVLRPGRLDGTAHLRLCPHLDDLEELNAALEQRARLEAAYTFLEDHAAI